MSTEAQALGFTTVSYRGIGIWETIHARLAKFRRQNGGSPPLPWLPLSRASAVSLARLNRLGPSPPLTDAGYDKGGASYDNDVYAAIVPKKGSWLQLSWGKKLTLLPLPPCMMVMAGRSAP